MKHKYGARSQSSYQNNVTNSISQNYYINTTEYLRNT